MSAVIEPKAAPRAHAGTGPISRGSEWTFELIQRYDDAIAEVAREYKLDTYPNQIEVITSEQMLDAYASVGLPIGYPHWSYGKEFIRNEQAYRKGAQGLAYEIVINSSPCISYLMEENSMAMQALVIAHACYGHNSFFKGNYLFKQWTDAEGVLDYLVFARNYVMQCEDRYGIGAVEELLDSCHALMPHGVDRYKRPSPMSMREEAARMAARAEHERVQYNDLWRTVPKSDPVPEPGKYEKFPAEPEENLLYFIEKYSPKLAPWQKELVRITRKVSQYFYPQGQTKVMNEGWATFWHYTILNRLHEKGLVDDGFMIEFLQSHTNVVSQRGFDQRGYGGINPYALGFAMMTDIRRICEHPTEEDKRWFPDIAGGDWLETLHFAMRNFKDESFISQYLSPKLIRDFRFFAVADHQAKAKLEIDAIHDDEGYRRIRKLLSEQHNRDNMVPDIQVTRFYRESDRSLVLRHLRARSRPLAGDDADQVMKHLARLWGFKVRLEEVESDGRVSSFREVSG
jgi:stage V sporulation protein R